MKKKKYLLSGPLNELRSGTRLVAVDLESTNTQVAGFDSDDEVVDLIHRITNDQIFFDAYKNRLKGTLGDNLALIVNEIEKICDENQINISKFLQMRERFSNLGA